MCGILALGVGIGIYNPQLSADPLKSGIKNKSIITQINLEKPLNLREFESFTKENNLPTELTLGTNFELGEYLVPTQLEYKTVAENLDSPNNPQAKLDPLKSGITQNYKTQLETIKKEIKNLKETVKNRVEESLAVPEIYTREYVENFKKQHSDIEPAKVEALLIPKQEPPKNLDIQIEQVAVETTAELDTNQELQIFSISFVAKDEVVADTLVGKLKVKKNDKKAYAKPKIQKKSKATKFDAISTEDISDMFAADPKAEAKVKDDAKKSLENFKAHSKNHKQYLNEMEASGYGKDLPENVEIVGKKKVSSIWENIQNLGSVEASAKGLNNAKFSLIMYMPNNQGVALQQMGYDQQAKLQNTTGQYGLQRWCFDNDTNEIWSTPHQTCEIKNGMWCLDIATSTGNYANATPITTHNCHGGQNQKWIFTEDGALASKASPNMCLDSAQGTQSGSNIQLYSCHSYASGWFAHQNIRAGYNNFGQNNMGMSIWTTPVGDWSPQFFNGHAYVELWNGVGRHNTFGKWPTGNRSDDTCNVQGINDICDKDDNQVSNPWEISHVNNASNQYATFGDSWINGKNYYYGKTQSNLSKEKWDYIAFGSGYRSNYRQGRFMDLGGSGTYQWNTSRSRSTDYKSTYNFTGTSYCSSYALSLWNNFRDSGSTNKLEWYSGTITPTGIYNSLQ